MKVWWRWPWWMLPKETTLVTAVLLASNVVFAVGMTVVVVLVARAWLVPSIANAAWPLDFVFDTCTQQLAGVCSFPAATVPVAGSDVFVGGIEYSLSLDLALADCEDNRQAGVFLTVLRVVGADGSPLGVFPRSTMFRRRSGLLNVVRRLLLWPLWLAGWTNEVEPLRVEFTRRYLDDRYRPASALTVELQNKWLVVDSARLSVDAQLGVVQRFLFDWPLLSTLVLTGLCLGGMGALSMLYWTQRSARYVFRRLEQRSMRRKTPASAVFGTSPVKRRQQNDAYFDANESSLPMTDIPGWLTDTNEIRRRQVSSSTKASIRR